MPRWRSLLLVAAMCGTMAALVLVVLAGLRHSRPFQFGRLEYTYDESWFPSPPRLILFPDGKVDMTLIDDHDRTVLIHPTRNELTDKESSRLGSLLEAVDWSRIRPCYDADVENGEESECRITVGNSQIETSVWAVGEAREPAELTALFHYLNDLFLVLSPPQPFDGIAPDPVDEIECSDCSPKIYFDEGLEVPVIPGFPAGSSPPRTHYGR